MKLGVAGMLGDGSPRAAQAVRALGFTSVSWHLSDPVLARDEAGLVSVRQTLEAEALELCQLLPPLYPSLVHPDAAVRRSGIDVLEEVVRAAVILGARCVYVRPGSLNPAGPWTPHPDNRLSETRDRLVDSLKRLTDRVHPLAIPLALEGHVVSPLHSVAVVREVFDRVDSPLLKFNADPVNFIPSLDVAYCNTDLINEMFDALGSVAVMAHAKDVTVEDRLVMHLEECAPGEGYLDQETFLTRFSECAPCGVVLIEHLPRERIAGARQALLKAAEKAGLRFADA